MFYNKHIVILFLLCNQFCFTQNLIQNGSFEDSLGNPSLAGWYLYGYVDTLFFQSSNNVPAGGGNWSVRLATAFPQTHHIAWFITGIQGTYVYKLSVWAEKTVPFYVQYPPIIVAIGIIDSTYHTTPSFYGSSPSIKGTIYDSIPFVWDEIVLTDTFTTVPTDTIAVILMGGTTINGPNDYVYYDLAELTITDTLLININTSSNYLSDITISPNPFNHETTIKFNNAKQALVELTVFSILGEVIKKVQTKEDSIIIEIEREKLSNGIYFFKLLNISSAKLIGNGKMLIQ